MKKQSKRTRKLQSSPEFTAKVFASRTNGLTNILTMLARAKGSKVQSDAPAVSYTASKFQLF